ncbi:MAG TPA: orotidine-5'-phosphate decarboxylase [Humibacter sp.]|nr:orotidine-5'-phosphate decarboxylase [Humibacter sp.]
MSETGFGARLAGAITRHGRLCVGVDPHPELLEKWALPDSAAGVREFGLLAVRAAAGLVAIVKPQVAFFERFGSAGYAALEEVIGQARAAGLLVLADAKRGDIGTSVEAYGQAWLTPGGPLEVDAVTLNPFQGVGALEAPFALAHSGGKGVFVLAATSNPEGFDVQRARVIGGPTVSRTILDEVTAWNRGHVDGNEWGNVGLVIGATVRLTEFGIDTTPVPLPPVLAPGFGFQGGDAGDLRGIFGGLAPAVLVSESRSILASGPDALRVTIENRVRELEDVRV